MAEDIGSLECTLPLHSVHLESLHVESPRKYGEKILFPIRYKDPLFTLQTFTLLLPPLQYKSYSQSTQLLEVLADPVYTQLQSMQDAFISQIAHQTEWLQSASLKKSELQTVFQPILKPSSLVVYLHPKTWIYQNETWIQGPNVEFSESMRLQLILRLQGLQVLPPGNSGKRIRIQHQTLGILCSTA